jgi:hypothetical protein
MGQAPQSCDFTANPETEKMGDTQIDGGRMTGLQSLFLALGGRANCRPCASIAASYLAPSFSKKRQMVSMPWWKFGI